MKKPTLFQYLIVCCGFFFTINCYSQDAKIEEWSGTLKRGTKPKEIVTYQVKVADEGPYILEMIYAETLFKIKEHRFEEGSLIFTWTPGASDASCRLEKNEEGVYAGECQLQGSSKKIDMQVIPLNTKPSGPDEDAEAGGS